MPTLENCNWESQSVAAFVPIITFDSRQHLYQELDRQKILYSLDSPSYIVLTPPLYLMLLHRTLSPIAGAPFIKLVEGYNYMI